jgi:hypothetical protein
MRGQTGRSRIVSRLSAIRISCRALGSRRNYGAGRQTPQGAGPPYPQASRMSPKSRLPHPSRSSKGGRHQPQYLISKLSLSALDFG